MKSNIKNKKLRRVKIFLIILFIMIIIFLLYTKLNNYSNSISSISYNVNQKDYYVYIKENGKYVKYLVLDNDYNSSGVTLLLRDKALKSDKDLAMIGNGLKELKYEETALDRYLSEEFINNFDNAFINLVNDTDVKVSRHTVYEENYTIKRKFFLLSAKEIIKNEVMDDANNKLLKYFENNNTTANNDDNIKIMWWTRTYSNVANNYCVIGFNGQESCGLSTDVKASIRPAFTISNKIKIKKEYINEEIGSVYILDY